MVQVQVLLAEIAMVEEEIACLEIKVRDLKQSLYQEREQHEACDVQQGQQLLWGYICRKDAGESPESPIIDIRCQTPNNERYDSLGPVAETSSISSTKTKGKIYKIYN